MWIGLLTIRVGINSFDDAEKFGVISTEGNGADGPKGTNRGRSLRDVQESLSIWFGRKTDRRVDVEATGK